MTGRLIAVFLLCAMASLAVARSPLPKDNQEFTDEDFQKFFGLLEDGKISRDKMEQRCVAEILGFSFTGENLEHKGEAQRINYNKTGLDMTVDGRPFRSKYRSPSFGEWTGEVFKPICPGLYSFSVDFEVRLNDGVQPEDVSLQLYMQREGDTRPGLLVMEAHAAGSEDFAVGHAAVVLPMATGDELSTWSAIADGKGARTLSAVSISVYKVDHLPELTKAFDQEAWAAEMRELGSRLGATMP
ncbi:MAG: hypothetical protein ACR2P6_05520 [Gammaproteobacteria bacterium]